MAKVFSKAYIYRIKHELHEAIEMFVARWRGETINPLLYVTENLDTNRINIHRASDDTLMIYMDALGDVYPVHMGLWEPEMAVALGEALVILGRGFEQLQAQHTANAVANANAQVYARQLGES
jgi:hypothetical protein